MITKDPMKQILSGIQEIKNFKNSKIPTIHYSVYRYGSRVYGTHTPESDHDFIVVWNRPEIAHVSEDKYSINYYPVKTFGDMVKGHEISALECLFCRNAVVKNCINYNIRIDLEQLRHSISEKASHSWVKSKKKHDVEKDYKAAKKSLFHSLRIIDFGTQFAKMVVMDDKPELINTRGCQELWGSLNKLQFPLTDNQWSVLKATYNASMTEFRKYAPK